MKIRSLLTCSVIGSALIIPVTSIAAEGLSYTFIEGNYVIQDIDLYDDDDFFDNFAEDIDDGDGFSIRGSLAFAENFFIQGSYSDAESDFSITNGAGLFIPQNEAVKTLRFGAGFNMPLASNVDLVASASYIDIDFGDFNLGSLENDDLNSNDDLEAAFRDLNDDSSDGFSVDLGARAQLTDWLELGGGARYTDIDTGDDISFFGNVLFEITENMGINLAGDFGDDISTYSLGFRYSF